MKTLIFSMSSNGENSVTLLSTRHLQEVYSKKGDTFEEIKISPTGNVTESQLAKFKEADLVMFATSMYHFMISSQAMDAMNTIGRYLQKNCPEKPVTLFMTSNYLMDVLIQKYMTKWALRYNMKYIKGMSIIADDILEEKYRADVYAWFNNVKVLMSGQPLKANKEIKTKMVVLDDSAETCSLAERYTRAFEGAGSKIIKIDMTKYNFKHCMGCQYCYTTRKCCIEDQFNQLANDIEADSDIIFYVGKIENGFYPSLFKKWMDRHVCQGRCPGDDETITVYAYREGESFVQGDDELFRQWANACTSFGGEVLIGIYKDFSLDAVNAAIAAYNEKVAPYRDFYWAALRTRFGDLARVIRNIEPLDYACFKSLGTFSMVSVNYNCRSITDMESAKKSVEMKAMGIRMNLSQGNVDAVIPERHTDRRSSIEAAMSPVYAPEGWQSVDLAEEHDADGAKAPAVAMAGPMMGKLMGKVGHRMGLIMNTFNTIIFSTIGTLSSGHFTWGGWLFGACVGWCTGAVITSIVPVKDTQDWILEKTKTDPDSFKGKLIASLTTGFIIMPAMTIVMGLAMPSLSAMNIENSAKQLETERTQLMLQQCELKIDQAKLQGQYDSVNSDVERLEPMVSSLEKEIEDMQVSVQSLEESIKKASSPAEAGPKNGQLTGLQNELKGKQAELEGKKAELEGKQGALAGMQSGINEMQSGIDNMQESIDGMTKGIIAQTEAAGAIRSAIPRSLPLSALLNTIIGIVLGMLSQPFFTKIVMRSVFGKNAPKS